jgi:carbon catabolite-derepressing protein kinase
VSPGGGDLEENPFEIEFNGEDDEDDDDGLFTPSPGAEETNNFAVLNSSLPLPEQLPEQHHLASYATAKRSGPATKEKRAHRTKWHFGIRSRSPPMEVVLEIYRTLRALGMEWKEKRDLGGLGGVRTSGSAALDASGRRIERNAELDGPGAVDLKLASDIYFVEARARIHDVVVRGPNFLRVLFLLYLPAPQTQILVNLQLYMVDHINYLVDFQQKASYRASTEPGAGKFDVAPGSALVRVDDTEVVSPFAFMDVAVRLILELAGGTDYEAAQS